MSQTTCPHCGKPIVLLKSTTMPEPGQGQAAPAGDPHADFMVKKTVACKRCGEEGLAWAKSKNGKFYLCRTEKHLDGTIWSLRKQLHRCGETPDQNW